MSLSYEKDTLARLVVAGLREDYGKFASTDLIPPFLPASRPILRNPTGYSLLEMLMVIVIIGILALMAVNVPHLVSSTRKATALQELLSTMESARGRALRNNGVVYLAFRGKKAGGSLEPLRQYAILDYDDTAATPAARFKLVTPWQKLPEGYVFVNSNVSTGTVSTNLLSFPNAAQDVPADGQNTSAVSAQCLAFGPLGQVIFPEGAIGSLQIPIVEGFVQSDISVTRKGSQPTAADCYYIEVRRNTGRAFLLP